MSFFPIKNVLAIHIKYYYFDSRVYIYIIHFIQMIKKKGEAHNPDYIQFESRLLCKQEKMGCRQNNHFSCSQYERVFLYVSFQ